jgi:hypothetical protein
MLQQCVLYCVGRKSTVEHIQMILISLVPGLVLGGKGVGAYVPQQQQHTYGRIE